MSLANSILQFSGSSPQLFMSCYGGRGAAAAAEAAAQERSRVRRRVSESPDFFERTCGPRDGPMDT